MRCGFKVKGTGSSGLEVKGTTQFFYKNSDVLNAFKSLLSAQVSTLFLRSDTLHLHCFRSGTEPSNSPLNGHQKASKRISPHLGGLPMHPLQSATVTFLNLFSSRQGFSVKNLCGSFVKAPYRDDFGFRASLPACMGRGVIDDHFQTAHPRRCRNGPSPRHHARPLRHSPGREHFGTAPR